MKISVALCTFNGASFIEEQLRSILNQTLPPSEIIVADDRSTDHTVAIVQRIASTTDVPIRVYPGTAQLGITRNFDRAIGLCVHDIIALSDQDDVWIPTKLEKVHALFTERPEVCAVFSDAAIVDEQLRPSGSTMLRFSTFVGHKKTRFRRGDAFEVMLMRTYAVGATIAFRASLREHLLPIPHDNALMLHDRWIVLVSAALSCLAYLDEELIWYRQHGRQQIGVTDPLAIRRTAEQPSFDGLRRAYAAEHAALCLLRDRLADHPAFRSQDVRLLASKLALVELRAMLPRSRGSRLLPVLRALAAGRYHRHARGFASVGKDLITSAW